LAKANIDNHNARGTWHWMYSAPWWPKEWKFEIELYDQH
jgi:hypothetical protein